MSSLFWASYVLLWLLCGLLLVSVVVLARLVGVLSARMPGRGALLTAHGPEVGEEVPQLTQLEAFPDPGRRWTMVAFLSPQCEDCRALHPALRAVAREESDWLELAVAPASIDLERFEPYADTSFGAYGIAVLRDADIGRALQVHSTPYVLVIDPAGVLRAKGVPNRREQLDGLLQAAREDAAPSVGTEVLPTVRKEAG